MNALTQEDGEVREENAVVNLIKYLLGEDQLQPLDGTVPLMWTLRT